MQCNTHLLEGEACMRANMHAHLYELMSERLHVLAGTKHSMNQHSSWRRTPSVPHFTPSYLWSLCLPVDCQPFLY